MLDTGKKLSDDNTIGQEEIQQRLAQFVDHWKELKDLSGARLDLLIQRVGLGPGSHSEGFFLWFQGKEAGGVAGVPAVRGERGRGGSLDQ